MAHTTARPPTLGDRLDDLMLARGQSCDDVARTVGATPEEVARWAADRLAPDIRHHEALARYLGVDVAEVPRLVLRGQMRKVQREIRDGTAPPSIRP